MAQPTGASAHDREEMWFLTLAKSKVMRFAALTCELVLFFGGLWITLTVSNPEAKTWANGTINAVFLTIMGFAIDAAMPESWIHVVAQHLTGKRTQEQWSRSVAVAMSLLFIGNIVYSFLTTNSTSGGIESGAPTDVQGWILLVLMISRIAIGFVYITVRECQEFITRYEAKQQQAQGATPAPPPVPSEDWQALVQTAIGEATTKLAQDQTQTLADLSQRFEQAISLLAVKQQGVLTLVQEVQDQQQTLQIAQTSVSLDEMVNTVLARLQTRFEEQQTAKHTRQLTISANSEQGVSDRETLTHTRTKQPAQTTVPEIAKRSKRIDPAEVDAVVHPLLNKERSLTHRKIAAMPAIPYTETVVYASVKRWREAHAVVVGSSTPEEETGVS